MRVQPTPLWCGGCGHTWTGELLVECSMTLATQAMLDVAKRGCPSCRAEKVYFDTRPRAPEIAP